MTRLQPDGARMLNRAGLHAVEAWEYSTPDSSSAPRAATIADVAAAHAAPALRPHCDPTIDLLVAPGGTRGRARRLRRAIATWLGWAAHGQLPARWREWRRQRRDAAQVAASPLFDADWYARIYADVDAADAARHYVRRGAAEGRSPGPEFDGPWYLGQYPHAALAGRNPLLHHIAALRDGATSRARKLPHLLPPPPARPLTADGYAAWLRDWDAAAPGAAASDGAAHGDPATGKPSSAARNPDKATAALIAIARSGEAVPETPWCLLLADDVALAPTALRLLADAAATPEIDLLTADEDVREPSGRRVQPRLQPGWDPDLLRATGYIGSGVAVRCSLLRELGIAILPDLPSLLLLLAGAVPPARALHVPAVLLHAARPPVWPLAVVQPALAAAGIAAEPQPGGTLRLHAAAQPERLPLVSVLIPTRDQADLLDRCVRGLLHATDYPAIELLIIDNASREPRTARALARLQADPRVRVIADPAAFDWSALNNRAAAAARGELLLLLNNDVLVREPGWLREMVGLALRPEVGAVGATLLYPSGEIQHAGVALHRPGLAAHLMRHAPAALLDAATPDNCPPDMVAGAALAHLRAVRAVAAVTGACLLLRRDVFDAVGGLAAGTLRVSWNDIDLCLRIRAKGFRVLCTPFACLTHLEGVSRGGDDSPAHAAQLQAEYAYMRRVWGPALSEDPHLNVNLGLIDERLVLASPPAFGAV